MYASSDVGAVEGDYSVAALEVQSPAQPVPCANAPTIYSRWKQWSAHTVIGAGAKVDVTNSIDRSIDALGPDDWRTVLMTKDNLPLNGNLVSFQEGALEMLMAQNANDEPSVTLIDFSCSCHSGVLAMKPLVQTESTSSTMIVKLGHVFQSGKTHGKYIEGLELLAKQVDIKLVDELPPQAVAWRSHCNNG